MRIRAACLFCFLTAAVVNVYAHPPTDLKITFDPATKMLQVMIMHDAKSADSESDDLSEHFIKQVAVKLNGQPVLSQTIARQSTIQSQTVVYSIPDAKAGDVLLVRADCSIFGNLEKELKVQ